MHLKMSLTVITTNMHIFQISLPAASTVTIVYLEGCQWDFVHHVRFP